MMQEELPMLYNQYKITIPHVFIYNIELRGKDYIQVKQRDSSINEMCIRDSICILIIRNILQTTNQ